VTKAEQRAHEMFTLVAHEMDFAGMLDTTTLGKTIPNAVLRNCVLRLKRQCGHVPGSGPLYVILATDTLCCGECLQPALAHLQAVDAGDQHCDICREWVEDNVFSEFVCQVGQFVLFGNRGSCCMELS